MAYYICLWFIESLSVYKVFTVVLLGWALSVPYFSLYETSTLTFAGSGPCRQLRPAGRGGETRPLYHDQAQHYRQNIFF